jgi:protein required for attachment to host cells
MNRQRIWYVVADGGRARIIQKRDQQSDSQEAFDTLQEMVSEDIHRATHDLGTGRPGRVRESAAAARHAVQPRQDLHTAEKQNFAHEVAAWLNAANTRDDFDALILVAPAHALADLRQALDEPTQRKITAQLQKDLTKVPNAGLAPHLADVSSA